MRVGKREANIERRKGGKRREEGSIKKEGRRVLRKEQEEGMGKLEEREKDMEE